MNPIAFIVGIVAGAATTTLIAKSQMSDAVTQALSRFGLPAQLLAGSGDPLATLNKIDPVATAQLETAWIEAVIGGSLATLGAYLLISKLTE